MKEKDYFNIHKNNIKWCRLPKSHGNLAYFSAITHWHPIDSRCLLRTLWLTVLSSTIKTRQFNRTSAVVCSCYNQVRFGDTAKGTWMRRINICPRNVRALYNKGEFRALPFLAIYCDRTSHQLYSSTLPYEETKGHFPRIRDMSLHFALSKSIENDCLLLWCSCQHLPHQLTIWC